MKEIWTEKYRPQSLKEVVGVPQSLLKLVETPDKLPHLLLYSKKPGTGKTSIARAIVRDLDAQYILMNASDERRIEDIREKVKRFVETSPLGKKIKIVILDECDGMVRGSQEALRSLMEMYSAKFIITANNIEKIIEPLQSRCLRINLQFPPKEKIKERLLYIIEKEGMEVEREALDKLIDIYYPSIRNMIVKLQELSMLSKRILVGDVRREKEEYYELYNDIKNGYITKARRIWLENSYPLREVLKAFLEFVIYDNSLKIDVIKNIILLIADADYRMAVSADEDITMLWFSVKMREEVKQVNM